MAERARDHSNARAAADRARLGGRLSEKGSNARYKQGVSAEEGSRQPEALCRVLHIAIQVVDKEGNFGLRSSATGLLPGYNRILPALEYALFPRVVIFIGLHN